MTGGTEKLNRGQMSSLRDGCKGLTCAQVKGKDEISCLELRGGRWDKRTGNDERTEKEGMDGKGDSRWEKQLHLYI